MPIVSNDVCIYTIHHSYSTQSWLTVRLSYVAMVCGNIRGPYCGYIPKHVAVIVLYQMCVFCLPVVGFCESSLWNMRVLSEWSWMPDSYFELCCNSSEFNCHSQCLQTACYAFVSLHIMQRQLWSEERCRWFVSNHTVLIIVLILLYIITMWMANEILLAYFCASKNASLQVAIDCVCCHHYYHVQNTKLSIFDVCPVSSLIVYSYRFASFVG